MIRTFDPMSDFSIETHAVSTFSKDMCLINLVPRVHSLALKPCGPGKEVVLHNTTICFNTHSFRAELEEMALRRALHFVFKIGNRNETIKFYREILGMKVRGISYCVTDFGASFRACPWMTQSRTLLHSCLLPLPYKHGGYQT